MEINVRELINKTKEILGDEEFFITIYCCEGLHEYFYKIFDDGSVTVMSKDIGTDSFVDISNNICELRACGSKFIEKLLAVSDKDDFFDFLIEDNQSLFIKSVIPGVMSCKINFDEYAVRTVYDEDGASSIRICMSDSVICYGVPTKMVKFMSLLSEGKDRSYEGIHNLSTLNKYSSLLDGIILKTPAYSDEDDVSDFENYFMNIIPKMIINNKSVLEL